METPENTTISSALDFKKKREAREAGDILTLASGLTVRLKMPDVTKVIAGGYIPAKMVQRFMDMQGASNAKINAEDLEAILTLQKELAKLALISPKIAEVPDYEQNEISLDDLLSSDLEEIWAYANGGLHAVEQFRQERNTGVLPGLDSEKVPEQKT